MRSGEELARIGAIRLSNAIESVRPKAIIGLFSGGHDSIVSTHIALKDLDFVLHLDTGIGIKETQEFVRSTCAGWGRKLVVAKASENKRANGDPDPQIYEDLVMANGFPGPSRHRIMYSKLKERPLRCVIRQLGLKRGETVLLVSGVRKEESSRRRSKVEELHHKGRMVWFAPCWDFTKVEVGEYMRCALLPRNPVVDALHKSGECLCGAFAKKGELEELRFWYPEAAAQIDRIQEQVKGCGYPWGWDGSPPKWWKETRKGQAILCGFEDILCRSCGS